MDITTREKPFWPPLTVLIYVYSYKGIFGATADEDSGSEISFYF